MKIINDFSPAEGKEIMQKIEDNSFFELFSFECNSNETLKEIEKYFKHKEEVRIKNYLGTVVVFCRIR